MDMKMSPSLRVVGMVVSAVFITAVFMLVWALSQDGRRRDEPRNILVGKTPVGMLGDSDTAAYQDHISFPAGSKQPGGAFHSTSLQWPEVLSRLRAEQVDVGPWAVWGVGRWFSIARVRDGLGLAWRGPQRETNQHNLAWASGCEDLNDGAWRQTPRLIDVMNEQAHRWRNGVVVIRMGVNNFGKKEDLAALAVNPNDPVVVQRMAMCVNAIARSVQAIHQSHPQVRIVLVGIFNNVHWVPYQTQWTSPQAQDNISRGLDHFDHALERMAATDGRLAFFDDRAWFASQWGQRSPTTGQPNYQDVHLSTRLVVTNTAGDSPDNAVLGNLHAGLVWNVLWTQALVNLVRERFGLAVDAVTKDDVEQFVAVLLSRNAPATAAPAN